MLALLLVVLTTAATEAATPTKRAIKIAAEDDWFPYSSIVPGSRNVEGFAPDLVRAVFKARGIEVEYIAVPFARCLYYADVGEVAGCFDVTKTGTNNDAYYWHAPPLFYEGLSVFSLRSHKHRNVTVKNLEGALVGITTGYTYPATFMDNRKIIKVTAPADDNQMRMLLAGRVEYVLIYSVPGRIVIKNKADYAGAIEEVGFIQKEPVFLAFSKTHKEGKEMSKIFESSLRELVKNGQYKKLYDDFSRRHGLTE